MQSFFFFNDTATTEIYTLSLHDALPISDGMHMAIEVPDGAPHEIELGYFPPGLASGASLSAARLAPEARPGGKRSEEHTSELQSQSNLVCRLLLEKKKQRQ